MLVMRFPEEIWRQIFREASTPSGIDELSVDPAPYFYDRHMGDMTNSHITKEELQETLKCRFNIVLVCRLWAAFGIPVLWTHLRLSLVNTNPILDILQKRPEFGKYVRCISPREQAHDFSHLYHLFLHNFGRLQSILGLCPRVHTLQLPVPSHSPLDIPESSKRLHLHLHAPSNTFPTLPRGLTSLRIWTNFGLHDTIPLCPMELPMLQSLDLLGVRIYHWVEEISKYWSLPSLKMLALPRLSASRSRKMLERYSTTLTTLRMGSIDEFQLQTDDTLYLPRLTGLYIPVDRRTVQHLLSTLKVPNLQFIVIHQFSNIKVVPIESARALAGRLFSEFLSSIHASAPPLATIRLYGQRTWLLSHFEVLRVIEGIRHSGRCVECQPSE